VLVRVNLWIVLVFLDNGTIHEITRTKHEPKYFRRSLDAIFEAKLYTAGADQSPIVNLKSSINDVLLKAF